MDNQENEKVKSEMNQKIRECFQKLIREKEGALFFWALLMETGLFDPSMTGNSFTFHNEGKRAIGIWILKHFESMGILDDMRHEYTARLDEMIEIAKNQEREE